MRSTIEVADDLIRRAKQVAVSGNIALRELVESAIRSELVRRRDRCRMPDRSFRGSGVQPRVVEGDWESV